MSKSETEPKSGFKHVTRDSRRMMSKTLHDREPPRPAPGRRGRRARRRGRPVDIRAARTLESRSGAPRHTRTSTRWRGAGGATRARGRLAGRIAGQGVRAARRKREHCDKSTRACASWSACPPHPRRQHSEATLKERGVFTTTYACTAPSCARAGALPSAGVGRLRAQAEVPAVRGSCSGRERGGRKGRGRVGRG